MSPRYPIKIIHGCLSHGRFVSSTNMYEIIFCVKVEPVPGRRHHARNGPLPVLYQVIARVARQSYRMDDIRGGGAPCGIH